MERFCRLPIDLWPMVKGIELSVEEQPISRSKGFAFTDPEEVFLYRPHALPT